MATPPRRVAAPTPGSPGGEAAAVSRLLDTMAHFLYAPTLRGKAARARWHHHIHLIPGWLLAWICDRYERALGVYEEDEPVDDIIRAYEDGEGGVTGHPQPTRTYACEHMVIAGPLTGPPEGYCGCEMERVETR